MEVLEFDVQYSSRTVSRGAVRCGAVLFRIVVKL